MITIPNTMSRPAELERDELKKQLADARAEIERLKGVILSQISPEPFVLSGYSTTATPEKDSRDELIEQMKGALNVLVASATPSGPLWHGSAEMQIARAALSAAERMSA